MKNYILGKKLYIEKLIKEQEKAINFLDMSEVEAIGEELEEIRTMNDEEFFDYIN